MSILMDPPEHRQFGVVAFWQCDHINTCVCDCMYGSTLFCLIFLKQKQRQQNHTMHIFLITFESKHYTFEFVTHSRVNYLGKRHCRSHITENKIFIFIAYNIDMRAYRSRKQTHSSYLIKRARWNFCQKIIQCNHCAHNTTQHSTARGA